MYPILSKRLGLNDENLTKYDIPLVGFNGKMVISAGQIKLLVVTKGKDVIVNFIVVYDFSLYMAILARLRIHDMGAM